MLLEVALALLSIFGLVYYYITMKYTYWKDRGVFQLTPSFPMGTIGPLLFKSQNSFDFMVDTYNKAHGHKMFGGYFLRGPLLTLRDPDLIRQVLVKDFDQFVDRNPEDTNKILSSTGTASDTIWMNQMTSLTGDEWKTVRSTFSPIFTSGKMKGMMPLMKVTSKYLVDALDKTEEKDFELKSIMGKFSMDTIASCAFGVDAQSFTNKESQFVRHANNIFKSSFARGLRAIAAMIPGMGKLMGILNISVTQGDSTMFFYNVVKQTLHDRMKNKVRRNDLIDLMSDAVKQELKMEDDDTEDQFHKDAKLNFQNSKKKELDEMVIVATAMIMLVAGYDTTGNTLSFAAFSLAKDRDIQDRLQAEIDAAYEDHDGILPDYNTIQNLPYLDMVIMETLRRFSPAAIATRATSSEYKIPGTDVVLEKSTAIHIPVSGIHMDPSYYPNPEKFNPENFSKENKAKRHPYTFLAFGQGPRGCIGMRFALLEAKTALVATLRNFNLVTCDKTVNKIKFDPEAGLTAALDGLWIRAERRPNHIYEP